MGADVKVGDFVELKNSTIGDGTKISHLTYVGDSDVGDHVNFGCGTVTVNYDGTAKYRTTIGDHAFIGCNTNLVAPVKIGDRAYTAAGSTVTEDVPADSLCIARSPQTIKVQWAAKRRRAKGPALPPCPLSAVQRRTPMTASSPPRWSARSEICSPSRPTKGLSAGQRRKIHL